MKRMLRKLMSTVLALTMVLSLVPVSALADELPPDVKYGSITNGAWTEVTGATGEITEDLPEGVSKVSKQAVKTADNTYQVTLTVEMTETTTTTPPDAVATVLVMDTSGSMGWCAKCGETCTCSTGPQWVEATTIDTGRTYYILGRDGHYEDVQYCNGTHGFDTTWNCEGGAGWYTSSSSREHTAAAKIAPKTAETPDGTQFYERMSVTVPTRLDGAKAAAIDFLKSYSGFPDGSFDGSGNVKNTATKSVSGRYVALVEFADLAETKQSWVDVATVSGYQAVFDQINGFVAGGSTNLDAGLRVADVLLKDTTVSSIAAKNVIALTDGKPTRYLKTHTTSLFHWFSDITIGGVGYCAYGDGSYCDSDTFKTTISTATTVKNSAKLYTICFGAGTDTMNDPDASTTITLANYLSQKIATLEEGKTYAYTADSAAQLSTAFKAISSTITSGLSSGTVNDSLPTGGAVTATGFEASWSLTKASASSTETVGNTTTYTWTKSYTVTLDPEKTNGQDYYPLNGQTQLVVDGRTIDFPIPAGRVKYPEYSTTYSWTNADQLKDGEATLPGNGSGYATEAAAQGSVDTTYTSTTKKAGKDGYYYSFSGWTVGTTANYVVPFTGAWTKTSEKVADMWATVKYEISGTGGSINAGQTTEFYVLKNTAWANAGITAPATTADTGYKFDGWSANPETITVDVTITGTFSIDENNTHEISYTVEYYKDGVLVSADTQTVTQSVQVLQNTLTVDSSKINTTDKYTGYSFDHSDPATIPTSIADKGVIKIYYVGDEYTVTYALAGGSWKDGETVSPANYAYGTTVTVTTHIPVKTGFTFNGWAVATGDAQVAAPTISAGTFAMPSANVTLTAQWTATVTGAKKELVTADPSLNGVSYDRFDNSKIDNNKIKADVGATVTLLYKITVTGGAGASFTVTDANTNLVYPATGVTANSGVYTGTVGSTGTAEFYVSKSFTDVTDNQALDNTITVSGVQNPQNPTSPTVDANKYTVTWKDQTGTSTLEEDQNVAYGSQPSFDGTAPTKAADAQYEYTFAGWSTTANAESGTAADKLPTVTGNVTYYAAFSKSTRSYTVTYALDGGSWKDGETVSSANYANGTMVTVTTHIPVKTDYVFTGWSAETDNAQIPMPEIDDKGEFTMPAANVTFTATWKVDKKGGGSDGSEPDDVPDEYQVFVYYVSNDAAKGTVAPTFEKIDLKDAQGNFVERKDNVTANGSVATAATDNAFDHWTKKVNTGSEATVPLKAATGRISLGSVTGNTDIYFTAYFDEDKIGGKDGETPGGSDGTPDKYQAVVTYKVVNGTWSDGSKTDKEAIFTLKTRSEETGEWVAVTPAPTLGSSIPNGMIAINEQYTDETAGWDAVALQSTTPVTGDATYTYRFVKIGSTKFDPDNAPFDNGDDEVSYRPIFWKQLTGILPGSETFQITLTEVPLETDDGSSGNIEIRPGDNKFEVVEPAKYTGTVTMSEAGRVAFDCETMSFDQPGNYIFIVKETKGDKSYIDYDSAEYELHISVGYPVDPASAQDEQEPEKTVQLVVVDWFIQGGKLESEGELEATFTNVSSYAPYVPPYVPVAPQPTVKVKGLDTVNHVAYIVGRDNGLVDPNGTITRAEVATIYFRLMTEEFRDRYWSDVCSFTDVADTAWYNVAIATLEKAGVIKDTVTGGSFRPNAPITRAELAVMAAQFCTVTGTIPKTSFTDIPSTYWAVKEIALVEYAGWIEGYNGKFRPDDDLTRAECVTIVNRMLDRGAEHEDMLDGMVTFPDNPVVNKQWYYEAIQEAANSHNYTRTGKLLTGEHFTGEKWTALLTAPDWAAMEQAWAKANQK